MIGDARTAAATARRRVDSEHKRERILTVARAWVDRGQDFSWEQLARGAQVNPGFVHRAPGLKAEIRGAAPRRGRRAGSRPAQRDRDHDGLGEGRERVPQASAART